jgi:hypothetical protein
MIFGGYGRKTKHRGDVFYICTSCEDLTVFGLVENYGYGQLYGVRVAKYSAKRYMLCSHCQSGYELTLGQFQFLLALSREIAQRTQSLDYDGMERYAIRVAQTCFPHQLDTVKQLVRNEPDPPLELTAGTRSASNPPADHDVGLAVGQRVERARNLARTGARWAWEPLVGAIDLASNAGDEDALWRIAVEAENLSGEDALRLSERATAEANRLKKARLSSEDHQSTKPDEPVGGLVSASSGITEQEPAPRDSARIDNSGTGGPRELPLRNDWSRPGVVVADVIAAVALPDAASTPEVTDLRNSEPASSDTIPEAIASPAPITSGRDASQDAGTQEAAAHDPEWVLRERRARSEIDRATFLLTLGHLRSTPSDDSAGLFLCLRLARGELSLDEFLEIRDDLTT